MSEWVETGLPCDCGSSDARSVNDRGWSTCFSCEESFKVDGDYMPNEESTENFTEISKATLDILGDTVVTGIPDRRLSPSTVSRFNVRLSVYDTHLYPYYKDGELVAVKKRTKDKKFFYEGDVSDAELFGQQSFNGGGRFIIITEGETDAMAAFQLQGSKYPAVSVPSSTLALKACRNNYEWLDSFEKIVICMDNDKAGKKAELQLATLFSGKAMTMKLGSYNDPVDMIRDGERGKQAFKDAFWSAELYTPEGILDASSLWDEVKQPVEKSDTMYPWDGMNKMTYGIRLAELVTICAGSGLGKSHVLRHVLYNLLATTKHNVGGLFLEESPRKTALSLMSIYLKKLLHLPTTVTTEDELRKAFDETLASGRVFLFDSFGSNSIDTIVARVRHMAKAMGCKYVFLDHISIVVSSGENGDERKALDEAMTKLRTLCSELNITIFLVSHLRRPQGRGHEEGESTSLSQLRGSASIAQLSDIVFGLERNGQADSDDERNTTNIRVLKNRFTGETGLTCRLLYDTVTGEMHEVHAQSLEDAEEAL